MTRLSHLTAEDLTDPDRDLLERPIYLYRALAHSPRALRVYAAMARWSRDDSAVSPRLRELAILCVGVCNRSAYEFAHHVLISAESGVNQQDVAAVVGFLAGKDVTLASAERTVLVASRDLSLSGRLDDRTWDALLDVLGMPGCLDLVMIISYYNMVSRIIGALEVEIEESYLPHLELYPYDASPTPRKESP